MRFCEYAGMTLVLMALQLTALPAPKSNPCPIPMEKGTQWTYEGKVAWTAPGSAKVKRAKSQWVTEVVDSLKGLGGQAAVIRGIPTELAWYEPGQSPGFSVLWCVSNHVYLVGAGGENQAKTLARQLIRNPRTLPRNSQELLELPLTVGHKWGGEFPDRPDTMYGWCVEKAWEQKFSVHGSPSGRPLRTYRVGYRTNPDHQLLEITPGLGITRFVYEHHGTVSSADVRLVAVGRGR